jgi:DNA-binding HxlR family transcriptional regulator
MERKSFEDMRCSVAQCLEIVGEWWSMLIVRDAFRGLHRFDEFQERLGIARNMLSARLQKLVEFGILDKQPYQTNPPRYDYVLTEKGRALWPVITSLRQWGDTYAAPNGPPVQVTHKACGHQSEFVLTCAHCGERVTHSDIEVAPGPGAPGVQRKPRRKRSA